MVSSVIKTKKDAGSFLINLFNAPERNILTGARQESESRGTRHPNSMGPRKPSVGFAHSDQSQSRLNLAWRSASSASAASGDGGTGIHPLV